MMLLQDQQYWKSVLQNDDEGSWFCSYLEESDPSVVVLQDKQRRGFIFFIEDEPDTVYVWNAYTHPAHRRNGVMTELIGSVTSKYKCTYLEVGNGGWGEMFFWEARGFRYSAIMSHKKEKLIWIYAEQLPVEYHFELNCPYYFILDEESNKAYPVNRAHDRLSKYPYCSLHPINKHRLRLVTSDFEEERMKPLLASHPELCYIYPDLDDIKKVHKLTFGVVSNEYDQYKGYIDQTYYPSGRRHYLYRGKGYVNGRSNLVTYDPPWYSSEAKESYEARVKEISDRYTVCQW